MSPRAAACSTWISISLTCTAMNSISGRYWKWIWAQTRWRRRGFAAYSISRPETATTTPRTLLSSWMNQAKALFEKVIDALKQWPRYASEAGVAEVEVAHIAAYQELL